MGLYADLQTLHFVDPIYSTASNEVYTGPGFNCDNPSLFSAEAGILCGFTPVNWPGYQRFYEAACVEPGLFHRFPGDDGAISIDELIGSATNSPIAAAQIVDYGRKHWWVFQPQGGPFLWDLGWEGT